MAVSKYGAGPYGMGKYSIAPGVNDAGLAVSQNYTVMRAAGATISVLFVDQIKQPTGMQLSGETVWQKVAVPACAPWFFVGTPASWAALANSAGAMFP